MPEAKKVTLKQVQEFFGLSIREFRTEWSALSEKDKEQIRTGLSDGSYDY